MPERDLAQSEVDELERRLAILDRERANLVAELEEARRKLALAAETEARVENTAPFIDAPVTMASPTPDKVALFRSLFRGREDVFPRRWENPNIWQDRLLTGMPQ